MFEHCWNVLKYAPKWLNSHQNETPRRKRTETTSSSINLEDKGVANDSNINLERPPGRKAEKARLNKQKSDEGSSSNVEVMLNAMADDKKKIAETRLEFLERGRVQYMELENKRLCIKEEKINLAKMKEERERIKEEETIRLAIMKEEEGKKERGEGKNERGEGNIERGGGNYDNECRCVASNATRIFSSTPIGNPCKKKW
uniref:No apical meristem-associated C-terminal domain-containing protein n=1 Tax=Fagus sylvatica TaxID=28930 RepID=A0A2N9J487_FAGSY